MRIRIQSLLSIFCTQFLIFCGLTHAADTPFSKYGVIQNVQNYSSNPYWSPNAPYNQRMPTPVYADGPDVETGDCQRVVSGLIATTCAMQNNCIESQLSDVRPTVMLQLSRIPNGNYATACAGYIDTAFDEYVQKYGNAMPTGVTAFPHATTPNAGTTESDAQIKNPYKIQLMDWQTDVIERKLELQELQSMNGSGNEHIERASFPTTYADLSFSERMANSAAGYESYKDKSAYKPITVESQDDYLTRQQTIQSLTKNQNKAPKTTTATSDSQKDQTEPALITENIPDEFEALLPWYGILVVKAGSLDEYAKKDLPIISTEYMKSHRDMFFPGNSDKALGMARACTHSNHMAHDNDVINRATHTVMNQNDSFWSGSDFYVYDGQDVYWGWAAIAGEVALALATFGISAEASAAKAAVQISNAGVKTIQASSKAITSIKLTKNTTKLKKAADAAKAAKAGKDATTRTQAIDALADAGITVKKGTTAKSLNNIGKALESAIATAKPASWTSSLWRPWKLVASDAKNIVPKTANALGPGATWSQRFKTLAIAGGAVGANYFGRELLKSFGYSTAALKDPTTGDVSFNSFGLLSDDNEEGRENVVSHGAWIQFETIGTQNEDDALNEATRFAEELTEAINQVNATDPQCDVDVYVVQPAISNPKKLPGAKAMWYIIQNNITPAFQVRSK